MPIARLALGRGVAGVRPWAGSITRRHGPVPNVTSTGVPASQLQGTPVPAVSAGLAARGARASPAEGGTDTTCVTTTRDGGRGPADEFTVCSNSRDHPQGPTSLPDADSSTASPPKGVTPADLDWQSTGKRILRRQVGYSLIAPQRVPDIYARDAGSRTRLSALSLTSHERAATCVEVRAGETRP